MQGIKVGDRVRVISKVKSFADGWGNCWVEDMDKYVNDGKIYTILRVSSSGAVFVEDNGRFAWPAKALENFYDLFAVEKEE